MRNKDKTGIVPVQYSGKEIRSKATIQADTAAEAKTVFDTAKQRLLEPNSWNKIAGTITAQFRVIDEKGNEVNRPVKQNDYLRVNIPGPGSKEGRGYDWVRVEELKESDEPSFQSVGFRVRPCSNPFSDKNETAHFYSQDATSSFIVVRDNKQVTSLIIDRNLQPNKGSTSFIGKVRDVVIGVSAIAGFSKIQWQRLADGLLATQ